MNGKKAKMQLIYLFFSRLAILFIGMGLFPILPLYAARFGADSTMIGIYLGLTYISITLGSILTGRFVWLFGRKAVFIAAGLTGIPALILLGQAEALWQVVVLTGVIWFIGGIGIDLIVVLTNLHSERGSLGRAYTVQSLVTPIGAVIGGLVVGILVQNAGYPVMFTALAVVWALWPVLALTVIDYAGERDGAPAPKKSSQAALPSASGFTALLVAVLLSGLSVSIGRLGLSLSMNAAGYSAAEISGANVIGGLAAIPIVMVFGALSDRLGRKNILILSFLITAVSVLILISAAPLWQFWLASILMIVAMCVAGSLASALAASVLSPEASVSRLPQINTASWVAAVIGFAGAGVAIDQLGPLALFSGSALLSVFAAALVLRLPQPGGQLPPKRSQPVLEPCLANCN